MLVGAERRCAGLSELLIAVSRDVKQQGLKERIGVDGRYRVVLRVRRLHRCFAGLPGSREHARSKLGLRSDELAVGWVGRFVPQKDPETLAEAIIAVVRARSDVRFAMVGDVPDRPFVERALTASELSGAAIDDAALVDGYPNIDNLYPRFDFVQRLVERDAPVHVSYRMLVHRRA